MSFLGLAAFAPLAFGAGVPSTFGSSPSTVQKRQPLTAFPPLTLPPAGDSLPIGSGSLLPSCPPFNWAAAYIPQIRGEVNSIVKDWSTYLGSFCRLSRER